MLESGHVAAKLVSPKAECSDLSWSQREQQALTSLKSHQILFWKRALAFAGLLSFLFYLFFSFKLQSKILVLFGSILRSLRERCSTQQGSSAPFSHPQAESASAGGTRNSANSKSNHAVLGISVTGSRSLTKNALQRGRQIMNTLWIPLAQGRDLHSDWPKKTCATANDTDRPWASSSSTKTSRSFTNLQEARVVPLFLLALALHWDSSQSRQQHGVTSAQKLSDTISCFTQRWKNYDISE